jgi:hypothetical protein
MLIARAHFHARTDTQIGHEITVINVTGATWFLGVIANFSTLLATIQRLHCDIDIHDPRLTLNG